MLDDMKQPAAPIEVVAYDHPFNSTRQLKTITPGQTVAEIVASFDLRTEFLPHTYVVLAKGRESRVVPLDEWHDTVPEEGTFIQIAPQVHGAALGMVLTAIVGSAAPYIAGTTFGLTGLAYNLVVAGLTIVGGLLINALIPPAQSPYQDDPNYAITGSSNAENKYGVYPTVLGRHQMFPPKTARGFTEAVGEDIYFHGRFTFGYGPVALETLKIGTTPITEFDDVEIEFLNVDQALTEAEMPDLAPLVVGWRKGSEKMSLYPDDIAEDGYNVALLHDASIVRNTRSRAISVSVDVSFPGLIAVSDKGRRNTLTVDVAYQYRAVGDTAWIDAGAESYSGQTTATIRFTKDITFPTAGEYEIQVTRLSEIAPIDNWTNESFLTAVRSVQAGELPSHPDISEIAVRIKGTEQLNGPLGTLNAITCQLAPVWNGTTWSAPQKVRHPAWILSHALMGPQLRDSVGEHRLQLEDLRAWANEESHWTCDYVIDQPMPLAQVLDLIAASGRAKRTMRDLKYSVIRDGGAGPVVQQFSPHNSYNFKGSMTFPRQIHGFRVRVMSEALDWEEDEIIVYADGYDDLNATEFETLQLPAVVLDKYSEKSENAWRLGRYHLAQAILRPETYEWYSDFEHLRCNKGDKIRLVHDVPLIGVGSGRVSGTGIDLIEIDENIVSDGQDYRLWIRAVDGSSTSFTATAPANASSRWWALPSGSNLSGILAGDLVQVEKTTEESMEILITNIFHEGDMQARMTGVAAAPAVLGADTGTIPTYAPIITTITPDDPAPLHPKAVVGFAVTNTTIIDAADVSKGPAIMASWSPSVESVSAIKYRVRLANEEQEIAPGRFDDFSAGVGMITQSLLPDTAYEVCAKYTMTNGRDSVWTEWKAVTTDDIRPTLADLDPTVSQSITDANTAADDAAADAGNVQEELDLAVATLSDDIAGGVDLVDLLRRDIARETGVLDAPELTDHDAQGWSEWNATGAISQVPNEVFGKGKTWVFDVSDTDSAGMFANSDGTIWSGPKNADAYVITVDFTLQSGDLSGAGLLFDWLSAAPTTFRVSAPLSGMITGPVVFGERGQAKVLIKRPTDFAGSFDMNAVLLMANYSPLGNRTTKLLKYHRIAVRVATAEEITSGVLVSDVNALVTRVGDAEGAILTEVATRTSETDALAASVNAVTATVAGNTGLITDEQTTRANETSALAVADTNIIASMGDVVVPINADPDLRQGVAFWKGNVAGTTGVSVRVTEGASSDPDANGLDMICAAGAWVFGTESFAVDADSNYRIKVRAMRGAGTAVQIVGVNCFDAAGVGLGAKFCCVIADSTTLPADAAYHAFTGDIYWGGTSHNGFPVGTASFKFVMSLNNTSNDPADIVRISHISAQDLSNGESLTAQSRQTASAVANANGTMSAAYVLRQVAGEAEGYMGMYAYSDGPSGPVSVVTFSFDYYNFSGGMLLFDNAELGSTNYVPGVSGWRVDAEGNAEFPSLLVTGSMIDNDATSKSTFHTRSSSLSVTGGSASRQAVFYTAYAELDMEPYTDPIFPKNPLVVVVSGSAVGAATSTMLRFAVEGSDDGVAWTALSQKLGATVFLRNGEEKDFSCRMVDDSVGNGADQFDRLRVVAYISTPSGYTGVSATISSSVVASFEQRNR